MEAEDQGSHSWHSLTCTWSQNQDSWDWGCGSVDRALSCLSGQEILGLSSRGLHRLVLEAHMGNPSTQ